MLSAAWLLLGLAPTHFDLEWAFLYSCSLIQAFLEAAFFVCIYLPRRYRLQKAPTIILVMVVSAFFDVLFWPLIRLRIIPGCLAKNAKHSSRDVLNTSGPVTTQPGDLGLSRRIKYWNGNYFLNVSWKGWGDEVTEYLAAVRTSSDRLSRTATTKVTPYEV